jgi:heme/copper-type cytochrome/quinol oxidase subunit 3
MSRRQVIDVSGLEHAVLSHRSPIWWGNVLLLVIESTMFGLLIAGYYYIWVVDFRQFPPPYTLHQPVVFNAVPKLGLPTVQLALLLLSCIPMAMVDLACLKPRRPATIRIGLVVMVLIGLASIVIRYFEFGTLYHKWDSNAYGSMTWMLLGTHMFHLVAATGEIGLMMVWSLTHEVDDKHGRDVRVAAIYWYWVAAIWLLLYAVVYISPRVL